MEETRSKRLTALAVVLFIALLLAAIGVIVIALGGSGDGEICDPSDMEATLTRTPDYGQNYVDNIIFLGDSSLYKMAESSVGVSPSQIWCNKDGGLPLTYNTHSAPVFADGKESVIAEALRSNMPRYVIITLGFENGVEFCSEETFKDYYSKVISAVKEASPDTSVMLQSILPVTRDFAKDNKGYTVEKISAANLWICQLAQEHGVRFLNTASALSDEDGYLQEQYSDGDTINIDGYRKLLEYVRTHGYN